MIPKSGNRFSDKIMLKRNGNSMGSTRKILILGASGLIGRFVTDDLRARGFDIVGVARKFSASQVSSPLDVELPVMSMTVADLTSLLRDRAIDVVVNCL